MSKGVYINIRGCVLGWPKRTRVAIENMLVCHFVDPNLVVQKEGTIK